MREASGSSNQRTLHHEVSAPLPLAWAWGPRLPGEGNRGIDLCASASQRQRVCMLKKTFPSDRGEVWKGFLGTALASRRGPSMLDRQGKMYLFVIWRRRAARPRPHPLSSKQTVVSPAPRPLFAVTPRAATIPTVLGWNHNRIASQSVQKWGQLPNQKVMHWCFFSPNTAGSTIHWTWGLCCHFITMLLLHMLMFDHDKVLISNDVD